MNDALNQQTQTSYYEKALNAIVDGRQGVNRGLSMGLDRGIDIIPNIQKGTYYVIGGQPASGKSSWALHAFMYSPIEDVLKHPERGDVKVYLFSFEITIKSILAKAIARRIFLENNILVDVPYLLSKGRNWCSDEIFDLVKEKAPYFEPLEDKIVIFDEVENPTGINKYLRGELNKQGKLITRDYISDEGRREKAVMGFEPKDPNLYNIAIIDHVGLTKKERGFSNKANIDKLSEYMFRLRNTYGLTPVITQQYNREVSNVKRFELKKLEPQLSDFKDSGNTTQDADIVIGIFNPFSHELPTWRQYDSGRLKDRIRGMCVLKNRDGTAGARIPLGFIGECGYFEELPKASKILDKHYLALEQLSKIH